MVETPEVVAPAEEEKKPEVLGDTQVSKIIINVTRSPKGISACLDDASVFPGNGIYIRGIFDQCRDQALAMLTMQQMKDAKAKPKIIKPGNPMMNGLRSAGSKILGR